jgi:hypothetical protein
VPIRFLPISLLLGGGGVTNVDGIPLCNHRVFQDGEEFLVEEFGREIDPVCNARTDCIKHADCRWRALHWDTLGEPFFEGLGRLFEDGVPFLGGLFVICFLHFFEASFQIRDGNGARVGEYGQ